MVRLLRTAVSVHTANNEHFDLHSLSCKKVTWSTVIIACYVKSFGYSCLPGDFAETELFC